MKPHTFNKFNTAGLVLASITALGRLMSAARLTGRSLGFSESTRVRHPDPEKQAAAEVKRMFRQKRNLFIQSRGGYGG